jgi:GDP-4-dehydro-6-deoxy-D-mannose reductase
MSRFLLTGGGGFVGQWLARTLLDRGDDVVLAGLGSPGDGPNILTASERGAVQWIKSDVTDQADVDAMLDDAQPDAVVHLAGVAFPPDADSYPTRAYEVNTLGAVRLLSACARRRRDGTLDPAIVIVGSATQYGAHDAASMPLAETAEQRPQTIYAASKAAQEIVALQMARAEGLRVVCARSFNHSGVGHGEQYLLPSLVRRIRQIQGGAEPRLALGNDVVRDYVHVRDVATAYLAMAERGTAGEVYNVASGVGLSVRELAAAILLGAGVTADISTDQSLVRTTDIPVLVGSPAKLMRDTGWVPTRTHTDIIDDLLHASTE